MTTAAGAPTVIGRLRAVRRAQRQAWLEAHPDLLARLPGSRDDVTADESGALDEAVWELRRMGLYTKTASRHDCRWNVRLIVADIRGEAPRRRWNRP